MSEAHREALLELIAEVEEKLAAARRLLTLPMESAVVLRCVELITSLQDSLKILETELKKLENEP